MVIRSNPGTHAESDPLLHLYELEQVREASLSGEPPQASPRRFVSESWERSLAAQVDPDHHEPPLVWNPDEVVELRGSHSLHTVVPLMRNILVDIADASQHIMCVTDRDGTILWREGAAAVCTTADHVGLREGVSWSERSIGTNAMGTALAVDDAVQIYSAEHLVRTYRLWSCAAAPIHDPDTGRVLGAVDVSGTLASLHPAMVSLVKATAQLAESHLQTEMMIRDEEMRSRNMPHLLSLHGAPGALVTASGRVLASEPRGYWPERVDVGANLDLAHLPDGREYVVEPLPDGYLVRSRRTQSHAVRPTLSLLFLRSDPPLAVLNGKQLPLRLRHAELLTALALHPAGLTAEQLTLHLYGEEGNPTTVRAEIHRLRAQLGEGVLRTRPYRLDADISADFLQARDALLAGDLHVALALNQTTLLARSEAPLVRTERDLLATALRSSVLKHRDREALWAFAQMEIGNADLEVLEQLVRSLPQQDPRRSVARARLERLLGDDDG